jgi:hypothetical protein
MKDYSGDISGSNIIWKHSQYSSQRIEHALPFSVLGFKMLTPEHKHG